MAQQIEIRTASAADVETVTRFNIAMALETERLGLEESVVRAGVTKVLTDAGRGFYLLACVGPEVIGQLMITFEWSDWRDGWLWWIQSVYVRPERRGMGIFRALYEHLEELATARGDVMGLRLYAYRGNINAHAVYRALGMRGGHYEVFEGSLEGA